MQRKIVDSDFGFGNNYKKNVPCAQRNSLIAICMTHLSEKT